MKRGSKFSQTIILIFVFPIVILMVLFLIIYTPVDFVRYCFSNRRKKMKRVYGKRAKYTWLITLTYHYRTFELISKKNLPIEFCPANQNPCEYGYFYYDKILFLPDVVPHFDPKSNNWYVAQGHEERDFVNYIELEKEHFRKCMDYSENMKCEKAVFLVKENEVYDKEKSIVETADFILTYNKKNFAQKINELLSK